jgi:hypothetical protein
MLAEQVPRNLIEEALSDRRALDLEGVDAKFWLRRHEIRYAEIERILNRIDSKQSDAFVDLVRRYGDVLEEVTQDALWDLVRRGKDSALRKLKPGVALPLSAPGALAAAITRISGQVNSTLRDPLAIRGKRTERAERSLLCLALLISSLGDEQDDIGFKACLGVAMGILDD